MAMQPKPDHKPSTSSSKPPAPAPDKPETAKHETSDPNSSPQHGQRRTDPPYPGDPNDHRSQAQRDYDETPNPNPLPVANRPGRVGEPDPPPRTIADEQRERSEQMQGEGLQAWKDEHDQRDPEDRPDHEQHRQRQVPGVGPTQVSDQVAPPRSKPS